MVIGTISELMSLLMQEAIRNDDREGEDRASWKPEVPFMTGSVEDPGSAASRTAHLHRYVEATAAPY